MNILESQRPVSLGTVEVTAQREVDYSPSFLFRFFHEVHIQKGYEVQLCLVGNHFTHSFFK